MNKINLSIILVSMIAIQGCSFNSTPEVKPPEFKASNSYIKSAVRQIKRIDNTQAFKMEDMGLFKGYTLPSDMGANPLLTKAEYELAKSSKTALLYPNFGVKNHIYFILEDQMWNNAEAKAQKYGYKNVQDMYKYIYLTMHDSNAKELESALYELESKHGINLSEVVSSVEIEKTVDRILTVVYSPYMKFEGMGKPELRKEWFTTNDGKKIRFTRSDYKPYALVVNIMNQLLD